MFSLLSLIARAFRPMAVDHSQSPAALLLERAESSVGRSPYHAQELRDAANAWLRVVR